MLRLDIRRVIANPATTSQRYQVEFYNLANSVKGASKAGASARGWATSNSWSNSARPTPVRRQRPAHRAHRGLAAAVRLRAARQRHPHGAAPRAGNVRFRIDGVLHLIYQIPTRWSWRR
jgi:general secretion pathway protein E